METKSARFTWASHSEMFPIVGSHFERVGILRTAAGGLPQYLSFPVIVLMHISLSVVLFNLILRPLFKLPAVRYADHIIIDRHRYKELSAFDVFNCWFCAYANGVCTMINTQLDHLSRYAGPVTLLQRAAAALAAVIYLPVLMLTDVFCIRGLYDVLISRPLGMHRTSYAQAGRVLAAGGYGAQFSGAGRWSLRYAKNNFLRFSLALEQIESMWCPLRHFETRKGIVYPEHHARFFGPGEIHAMRETLRTVGTVSPKRPTW